MALITDTFTQATNGTRPVPTTVTGIRTPGATNLSCNALTGWPTATAVHFITYKTDTSGAKVAGSQADWKGIVSGTTITTLTLKAGTDAGNVVGDIVEAAPTAAYANDLATGWGVGHNQDGTHQASLPLTTPKITTSLNDASGNTVISMTGSSASTSVKLTTTAVGPTYVESGCIWTADAAGSTKNASMSSGVVYINGVRLTVAAIVAQVMTANDDNYIDFTNAGNGTVTVTTQVVANNAASPALAANGLRNAIIVCGATSIASSASINQGSPTAVLPIASSVAYSVVDSLGNLIYPSSPNPVLIGYRQILGNLTTASTTETQVAGLSVPVIIPAGRRIKITAYTRNLQNATTSSYARWGIWDGAPNVGTELQYTEINATSASGPTLPPTLIAYPPSTGSKTFNVGFSNDLGSGTVTLSASATGPAFISVELV